MKEKLLILSLVGLLFGGCIKHDFETNVNEQVTENVKKVFGVEFDKTHDWCLTNSGTITINNIPSNVDRVQLLVCIAESDSTTSLTVLNEKEVNGQTTIKLAYDAPNDNLGLYVAYISANNFVMSKVENNTVASMARRTATRAEESYVFPSGTPVINGSVESYASQRGWIEGEQLYSFGECVRGANDYDDAFKTTFRAFIFSYFKNGRQYNNLPLVKESGVYNDTSYPITTGEKPIIVSPVYKSDKAKQYGNEVWNSDLYYYYYKEEDMVGQDPVAFIQALPKYKAIEFKNHFGETEDDVISKRNSFILAYFGDDAAYIGKEGTYHFPKGYKIGFMVRAKTEYEAPKKQGELYGDGRLNAKINAWPNFKSSKLGADDPRIAWLTLNGKMIMCWESGTDSDFNDILLEVEGGVKPLIIIPDIENNFYTFCFEDTKFGDYDMNDVVIKAERISSTKVRYTLVACGALDMIRIKNINGEIINDNIEVHQLFGVGKEFVNTVKGQKNAEFVVDDVTVDETFSFLNEDTQPYIEDISTGLIVKISKFGEDPHGIMIPYDFKHPIEKLCIKNAYSEFNNWGMDKVESTDWYTKPILENVWN
jgi:hypothetical protein